MWICSIQVIILYNIVSMSSSPTSHTFFHVYHVYACQFKQVWCWDVDQMLYFTLEKHKKCKSFRGFAPDPVGEAHSAPPDPLARYKPILCLVCVFHRS